MNFVINSTGSRAVSQSGIVHKVASGRLPAKELSGLFFGWPVFREDLDLAMSTATDHLKTDSSPGT
jgi:hypothetical protein